MAHDEKDGKAGKSQVVDLASFRKSKEVAEELTRGGRSPLYVSHMTGKVTGSPHMKRPESPDFGDRLQRIRSSLEKINRLMTELKKMSTDGTEVAAPPTSRSKS
jgi:hypothetical protein